MRNDNDSEVGEALRHAAARLGQDLSRTAHDAREAAKHLVIAMGRATGEAALERTERASQALGASVRRNPALWLAGAAGLGAVVAIWISRRSVR